MKKTKIVCTLGPASDSVKEITELANAGMNVARLNFSHGTYEHHAQIIKNLRKVEKLTDKKIGILQDLQGPKIRITKTPEDGITVKPNQVITFTTSQKYSKDTFPINYKGLPKDVKKNDTILINDGLIETKILSKTKTTITVKVLTGGTIKKGNGLNFPDSDITLKTITEKDLKDLKFGLEQKVDFIALSFVKSKKDIEQLRKLTKNETAIIAKIERHEALNHLIEIIKSADGVMVARGDLGADVPPEKVPVIQKKIIHLANKYGKPVITATQVLQSMVKNPRPTRAEISDAANAVFDHTDAIMLSNESAVGKYPAKAANFLNKVAITVEKELEKNQELIPTTSKLSNINAACLSACEMAMESDADAIIIYTESGYTARNIAKFRPTTKIITITPSPKAARELTLVWGINEVYIKKFDTKNIEKIEQIKNFINREKLLKKGQEAVIISNASKKENLICALSV